MRVRHQEIVSAKSQATKSPVEVKRFALVGILLLSRRVMRREAFDVSKRVGKATESLWMIKVEQHETKSKQLGLGTFALEKQKLPSPSKIKRYLV
jgi:hypothetical protein